MHLSGLEDYFSIYQIGCNLSLWIDPWAGEKEHIRKTIKIHYGNLNHCHPYSYPPSFPIGHQNGFDESLAK